MRGLLLSISVVCLLIILLVVPAGVLVSQIFFPPNATTVTTLADSGPGSLRQAIFAANRGDIITFDASLRGVIKLGTNLYIDKNLTIRGPGAGNLSITGDGASYVVSVDTTASVTISDLAFNGTHQIQHGLGIISNGGSLTLDNSTVSGNTATYGGGIDNGYSDVHDLTMPEFTQGGPLYLTNSTISDNTATHGGGILANSDNQANIIFSTIFGNSATGEGGGIAILTYNSFPSLVELRNTLVAGNHAHTSPDIVGMLTSDGYNLIQNVSGATFIPNKQLLTDVSVNPYIDMRIDPALNGNPPQVLVLLPGSSAIDQIPLDACHINGISTDQRGVKRPDGNEHTCDIGAYESSY